MDYDSSGYATQDSWNEHWYARCWDIIEKYDPDMFNNDSPYPKIQWRQGTWHQALHRFHQPRPQGEQRQDKPSYFSFKDGNADRAAFTYNLERGGAGEIKPEPWMWATDLSGGWFYRKGAVNRMSIPVMVGNGVDAISKNGVVMLNIALRGDGTLPEKPGRLSHGLWRLPKESTAKAIYGARPWKTCSVKVP